MHWMVLGWNDCNGKREVRKLAEWDRTAKVFLTSEEHEAALTGVDTEFKEQQQEHQKFQ